MCYNSHSHVGADWSGASGLLGRAVVEHLVSKHVKNGIFQFRSGLMIVTPLALTRAAVVPAYTKLDLMDKEAVAGFFQTHSVKGMSPTLGNGK